MSLFKGEGDFALPCSSESCKKGLGKKAIITNGQSFVRIVKCKHTLHATCAFTHFDEGTLNCCHVVINSEEELAAMPNVMPDSVQVSIVVLDSSIMDSRNLCPHSLTHSTFKKCFVSRVANAVHVHCNAHAETTDTTALKANVPAHANKHFLFLRFAILTIFVISCDNFVLNFYAVLFLTINMLSCGHIQSLITPRNKTLKWTASKEFNHGVSFRHNVLH